MNAPADRSPCTTRHRGRWPGRRLARARPRAARPAGSRWSRRPRPTHGDHPSFDERTTALANGSVRVFRSLGVWRHMEREATPIRRIHVSDQGRFGTARIDAAEQGLESLGYVVPNRVIGAGLQAGLAQLPDARGVRTGARAGQRAGRRRPAAALRDRRRRARDRRAPRRRGGRRALAGARAGRHRGRALGLRPDRDHRHAGDPALPRPRRLRALHRRGTDRRAAARRRALRPRLDAPPGEARRACSRCPTRSSSPSCSRRSGSGSAGSSASASGSPTSSACGAPSATSASGWRWSATPRRHCTRSQARASTSGCATRRASPRCWPTRCVAGRDGRGRGRARSRPTRPGATRTSGASSPSPTDSCACSPRRSARCARCAASGLLAFDALPPAKSAMARLSVGASGRVPRLARGVPLAGER